MLSLSMEVKWVIWPGPSLLPSPLVDNGGSTLVKVQVPYTHLSEFECQNKQTMSEAHIGDTAKVKSSNVDSSELNPSSECIGYIQGQHRAGEEFGKHDENCNWDKRAWGRLVESTFRRYRKTRDGDVRKEGKQQQQQQQETGTKREV